MICKNCGTNCSDSNKFCIICGAPLGGGSDRNAAAQEQPPAVGPSNYSQPTNQAKPAVYQNAPANELNYDNILRASELTEDNLPDRFKPMSTLAYFGYLMLYSCVPCVGLILAIIFAVNDDNINRRNFSRGYLCVMGVGIVLSIIISVFYVVLAASLFRGIGIY